MIHHEIRAITADDLSASAQIIMEAYNNMAGGYGFPLEADTTRISERLKEDFSLQVRMYGAFTHGIQVGFMALDEKDEEIYEVRQLSVLPDGQQRGCGRQLLAYAEGLVRSLKGVAIVGAVIDDNKALKRWLLSCGFYEEACGQPDGFPCQICLLQKDLPPMQGGEEGGCSCGCC